MSHAPEHFACWFEIPVTDIDASMKFYASVFNMALEVDHSGPNPMVMFPVSDDDQGVSGHLYPGKPSKDGSTIHLVIPDTLDAAKARVEAAGGQVESAPIDLPAGQFFYARDLDGNSIGLFKFKT